MDWNLSTAARTLWQEARGETPDGQCAVAHVLVNRLKSGRWGPSMGSICLSRAQFSAWGNKMDPNFYPSCDLSDDDLTLAALSALVSKAMSGEPDPTGGALYYHAANIRPAWTQPPAVLCGRFGNQLFWKNIP